jgi:hypothetical protein
MDRRLAPHQNFSACVSRKCFFGIRDIRGSSRTIRAELKLVLCQRALAHFRLRFLPLFALPRLLSVLALLMWRGSLFSCPNQLTGSTQIFAICFLTSRAEIQNEQKSICSSAFIPASVAPGTTPAAAKPARLLGVLGRRRAARATSRPTTS